AGGWAQPPGGLPALPSGGCTHAPRLASSAWWPRAALAALAPLAIVAVTPDQSLLRRWARDPQGLVAISTEQSVRHTMSPDPVLGHSGRRVEDHFDVAVLAPIEAAEGLGRRLEWQPVRDDDAR